MGQYYTKIHVLSRGGGRPPWQIVQYIFGGQKFLSLNFPGGTKV